MRQQGGHPQWLMARIGGFMGESYEVFSEGETLVYRSSPGAYEWEAPLRFTPSEEQWRAFAKALNRERLWDWAMVYPNPGVLDGTRWSIELEWGTQSITTRGDNNYPSDDDPQDCSADSSLDESKRFVRVMSALSRLIGRPFR